MYLSINEKPNMSQLYSFIFHYLEENKLKIFRWKLLHYIIPTKKLLMKWRIAINNQCNFCGQDEDYLHYFISCPYLKKIWVKIQQILKKSTIENLDNMKQPAAILVLQYWYTILVIPVFYQYLPVSAILVQILVNTSIPVSSRIFQYLQY